jgi:CRP-like cAMP-binding protein
MRRAIPKTEIEKLRAIPMFSACNDRELAQIRGLVDEVSISKGAVLAEQGTPARQAFIMVSGRADVIVDGQKIAQLGAGDSFGEMALLSRKDGLRSATVVARTDIEALVLEPRAFTALAAIPPVARRLLGELSDRLRDTDELAASNS